MCYNILGYIMPKYIVFWGLPMSSLFHVDLGHPFHRRMIRLLSVKFKEPEWAVKQKYASSEVALLVNRAISSGATLKELDVLLPNIYCKDRRYYYRQRKKVYPEQEVQDFIDFLVAQIYHFTKWERGKVLEALRQGGYLDALKDTFEVSHSLNLDNLAEDLIKALRKDGVMSVDS